MSEGGYSVLSVREFRIALREEMLWRFLLQAPFRGIDRAVFISCLYELCRFFLSSMILCVRPIIITISMTSCRLTVNSGLAFGTVRMVAVIHKDIASLNLRPTFNRRYAWYINSQEVTRLSWDVLPTCLFSHYAFTSHFCDPRP